MAPREEESLHPIAPVVRARAGRPVQVPVRTGATFPFNPGAASMERRRKGFHSGPPPKEATPETYDEGGHVHPAHPEPAADHLDEEV